MKKKTSKVKAKTTAQQGKIKKQAKAAPRASSQSMTNKYSGDITSLILRDHEPLKKLILILKDSELDISKKHPAYREFKNTLTAHAKAEEESLYIHMKEEDEGKELRVEGYEGDTEHAIADDLINEIDEVTDNDDKWMAKVKVLAELVDHHIKEEEKEFFKKIRKEFGAEERIKIGKEYSRLLNQFSADEDEDESEDDYEKTKPTNSTDVWA